MVEERAVQLAPPPGVAALDPLMQLQQNLAALNQVNQAIGTVTDDICSPMFQYQLISRGQHSEAGAARGG